MDMFLRADFVFAKSSHSTLRLAVICVIFLLCSKLPGSQYGKSILSALILVVVATSISYTSGESTGWDIVGALPPGLPGPVNFFNLLDDGDFWSLWVPSILITILSFIESIAVAQKFADKHDYSIDASQELLALGFCNIIGCWFQIYPVSGVLSLATVVQAAGATTPLYGIMAGTGLISGARCSCFCSSGCPSRCWAPSCSWASWGSCRRARSSTSTASTAATSTS